MSTRAAIAFFGKMNDSDKEPKYHAIYTHFDGYPSHHLPLLIEHFATIDRLKELISLGDVSVLTPNIDGCEGHSFDTPAPEQTIFYGRDRGEEGTEYKSFTTKNGLLKYYHDSWAEYVYTFDEATNEWTYQSLR